MKKLAPGVFVIGRYEPDQLDPAKIGTELVSLTNNLNLETFAYGAYNTDWTDHNTASEVRAPRTNEYMAKSENVTPWHKDNSGKECALVLWSNREQTEIKTPNGDILKPDPFDVLCIANAAVEHRTPPQISEDRWFFRRTVKVPDWMVQ